MPIVCPPRRYVLLFYEQVTVPLVDDRIAVRNNHPRRLDALGETEEMATIDTPVFPLLGSESTDRLEENEATIRPDEDLGIGGEIVGTRSGPDGGHGEERPVADREKFRILAARCGEFGPWGEPPVGALEQQQVGVAVTTVHVRRLAGDVPRQLRNGQKLDTVDLERFHRSSPGRGDPLKFGEDDRHEMT